MQTGKCAKMKMPLDWPGSGFWIPDPDPDCEFPRVRASVAH